MADDENDAATTEPEEDLAGADAPEPPTRTLDAPAIEYVGEHETVGEFFARMALEARDELHEHLSEGRTDEWIKWLDEQVDVPYVPDRLAMRVLDWLMPGPLLTLLDVVLFSRLVADGADEDAEEG